jgi:hypothetical protein
MRYSRTRGAKSGVTLLLKLGLSGCLLSAAWLVAAQTESPDSDQEPAVVTNEAQEQAVTADEGGQADQPSAAEQAQPSEASNQPRRRSGGNDRARNADQAKPGSRDRSSDSRANPSRQRDRTFSGPGSNRRGDSRRQGASDRMPGGRQAGADGSANSPGTQGYVSFKLIAERNIFNTTRVPRTNRASPAEGRRPARVDTFTLVGTLTYEKGPYAFFDGSSSEYRKVVETGHTIAGHKIAAIMPQSVKLTRGTNTVELYVGAQMRREDSDWEVHDQGRASRNAAAAAASDPPTATAADESDVIKRLMQQRDQDLGR